MNRDLEALTTADIDDLIAACAETDDPAREQEAPRAAAVLAALAQRNDPRFSPAARARWAAILSSRVRNSKAVYWRSQRLIFAWAAIDRAGVEQALVEDVTKHGAVRLDAQMLLGSLVVSQADEAARRQTADIVGRLVREFVAQGKNAWGLIDSWIRLDRPGAERFLITEMSTDGLAEGHQLMQVFGLTAIASDAAKAKLAEIRARGGRAGERATASLERLGAIEPVGLQAIVEAWRKTPTSEVLNEFYKRYIDGMPEGVPISTWVDQLQPRKPDEYVIGITASDGAYLHLVLDVNGNLVGWKLT